MALIASLIKRQMTAGGMPLLITYPVVREIGYFIIHGAEGNFCYDSIVNCLYLFFFAQEVFYFFIHFPATWYFVDTYLFVTNDMLQKHIYANNYCMGWHSTNALDSYLGGTWFESHPGHCLSSLRFSVNFLSLSRQVLGSYLN